MKDLNSKIKYTFYDIENKCYFIIRNCGEWLK